MFFVCGLTPDTYWLTVIGGFVDENIANFCTDKDDKEYGKVVNELVHDFLLVEHVALILWGSNYERPI